MEIRLCPVDADADVAQGSQPRGEALEEPREEGRGEERELAEEDDEEM